MWTVNEYPKDNHLTQKIIDSPHCMYVVDFAELQKEDYILVAVGLLGILTAKQKLGVFPNFI